MTKIKNEAEFYKKLSAKQLDKYSSEEYLKQIDPNDYQRVVRTHGLYSPMAHIKELEQYISQIKLLQKVGQETSSRTHIDGPKEWYTHRDPRGCFMCKDQEFISVLVSVLEYISVIYPHLTLRP